MRLHLDADTSMRALREELRRRGHDATRTPCSWIAADAGDEEQLLRSTSQGRTIFTFNVRGFTPLATRYPMHAGIVLAAQSRWRLPALIDALDALLVEHSGGGLAGRVMWPTTPRLLSSSEVATYRARRVAGQARATGTGADLRTATS